LLGCRRNGTVNDLGFTIYDLRLRIYDWGLGVMDRAEMQKRTKALALRIIRVVEGLPRDRTAEVIGRQLLRCGTSVGANYRAACRARSKAEFIAKMGIVEEEADESLYWMELLIETGLVKRQKLESLIKETDEILSITVASIKTARKKK